MSWELLEIMRPTKWIASRTLFTYLYGDIKHNEIASYAPRSKSLDNMATMPEFALEAIRQAIPSGHAMATIGD